MWGWDFSPYKLGERSAQKNKEGTKHKFVLKGMSILKWNLGPHVSWFLVLKVYMISYAGENGTFWCQYSLTHFLHSSLKEKVKISNHNERASKHMTRNILCA